MNSISFYFGKYQNLGLEQKTTKTILKEVLKEVASIEIENKDIKIKNEEIILNLVGPGKSQVLIYKNKINKLFLERLSERGIKTQKKVK